MIRTFTIHTRSTRHITLSFDLDIENFPSDAGLDFYWQNGAIPEPEVVQIMLRAIKTGDTVIDAGANVGFFTVLMSKLVGAGGQVYAFEPDWRNYEKLKHNLALNNAANVEMLQKAVGETVGATTFYPNAENGMSSVFGDRKEVADVVAMTCLAQETAREVKFMKMDIEGSELAAMRGLGDVSIDYIVAEVNDTALRRAGTSGAAFIEYMDGEGYTPFVLHENGQLPSRVWHGQKFCFTRQNVNMLFCTPSDLVKLWPEVEL